MNVDAQDEQARDTRCKERRHPKHHGERREQGQDGDVTQRMEASHAASGLARVAPTSPISRTNVAIAARRVRNAVTTSGSNCIPASARMAAVASSWLRPPREDRLDVGQS